MPRRRKVDHDALDELIRRRQGVLRVSELERLGVPGPTVSYRTRAGGPWQRILPGVVLAFSGAVAPHHRRLAAIVYARGGALLTGLTALELYGLRDPQPDQAVQVLVPHRRRRASSGYVVVERTIRMPSHRWRSSLPCAPPARAVIDACRRLGRIDTVRSIIADAVQRGLCTIPSLLTELAESQIRGTKLPRLVLREVIAGTRSVAEGRTRELMRRRGIPEPLWNHDVYDSDGSLLCRPDAIWPELGVVLEVDSMAWHLSPASYRRTQARQRRMAKYGLIVIPVAPSDLGQRPLEILAEVEQALSAAKLRTAPAIVVRPSAATAA
ncbi:type IV toxin-antitoxin system AbiEi family antitoxin [Tenggerimyces flavus]|uniref:Type IV toxin-antitoxin system AbiEi family antitoxin n=1 Tax=Tenggerimyces flavus TaxID=1708749 RepID=A0ABV7YLM6_9ACTN|nr:type IV toxin-antitoxin system AbiEi family antitoxin [Tenggerimyces flavus]MBM7785776.1 hypothetical protein [Tenggerimyces flavus]